MNAAVSLLRLRDPHHVGGGQPHHAFGGLENLPHRGLGLYSLRIDWLARVLVISAQLADCHASKVTQHGTGLDDLGVWRGDPTWGGGLQSMGHGISLIQQVGAHVVIEPSHSPLRHRRHDSWREVLRSGPGKPVYQLMGFVDNDRVMLR